MSCRENRHFTSRCNGIDFGHSLGGDSQLIRQIGNLQTNRRSGFGCIDSHKISIVYTIDYLQGSPIHPGFAYNTAHIGIGSCVYGSNSRSLVYIHKIVFGIPIDSPFFPKPFESPFTIHGRKGFDVIHTELVDGKPYHQLRHRRHFLSLKSGQCDNRQKRSQQTSFHLNPFL